MSQIVYGLSNHGDPLPAYFGERFTETGVKPLGYCRDLLTARVVADALAMANRVRSSSIQPQREDLA